MSTDISIQFRKLGEKRETKWLPVVGSAVGVLMLIAVLGKAVLDPINDNQNRLTELIAGVQKDLVAHAKDGHPERLVALIESNAQDIEKQDVVLQREMRLLDERNDSELGSLALRLQNEMRLQNETQNAVLARQNAEINRLRDWTVDHDKRVVGLNAAQWARIKALEREVYGLVVPGGKGAN